MVDSPVGVKKRRGGDQSERRKGAEAFSSTVETHEELLEIKEILKTSVGVTFNTNVMRIALNMQEERIASLLIAYYKTKMDEEMILRAVKTGQIDFL